MVRKRTIIIRETTAARTGPDTLLSSGNRYAREHGEGFHGGPLIEGHDLSGYVDEMPKDGGGLWVVQGGAGGGGHVGFEHVLRHCAGKGAQVNAGGRDIGQTVG